MTGESKTGYMINHRQNETRVRIIVLYETKECYRVIDDI